MVSTKKIPIEVLGELGLHEGDTLRILTVVDESYLVSVSREEPAALKGRASEWLKSARGTVRLAEGESADDIRQNCYTEKFGLDR